MSIVTEIETITPAKAAHLLEGNIHNRKINQRKVQLFADAMKRGEWQLNGENIKLNGDLVLDGQHRLWACITANKSFKTFVVKGLPKSVQQTIDTGTIRTNAHHLQMIGEKYSGLLAGTITLVSQYDNKDYTFRSALSHIQTVKFLEANPTIRDYVHHYGSVNPMGGKLLCAASHFIFNRIDPAQADDFMEQYTEGLGLTKGSPVLTLRNRIIKDMSSEHKLHRLQKFAFFIKAWNFCRKGESNTRLQFTMFGKKKEAFPVAK